MNRRNRGLYGFFEDLGTGRDETGTKLLSQHLKRVGLRTEIETWLDSLIGKKMAEHTKDFRRDFPDGTYDSLHIFPVTAALLLHRFDMLKKLQDLGYQMFRPNMQNRKDRILYGEKCSFSKDCNDIENVDLWMFLITNLKGLKSDEVRKIQAAVKRDFECKSEEQRGPVFDDIVNAFKYDIGRRKNICFCWSRIKKYHPWLADALLSREYSSMRAYPFIKDWLEFNKNDQSRKERISKLVADAGYWDIFSEACSICWIYEYDEYFDAVKFAEEYVKNDADNEGKLFSQFAEYAICANDIEERRKNCLYAAIKEMSARQKEVLKKVIAKNAFTENCFKLRYDDNIDDDFGCSYDPDGTFRYLVGLLQGETINIKYLRNAVLGRDLEYPECFEYQKRIFRILPLNPGNRKRLYAFHKALIRLDSEEMLTDAIGRGLFGRGNLREAVEYAENRKCCSVLPLLITEEYRSIRP